MIYNCDSLNSILIAIINYCAHNYCETKLSYETKVPQAKGGLPLEIIIQGKKNASPFATKISSWPLVFVSVKSKRDAYFKSDCPEHL
jgi:hypothetical protein